MARMARMVRINKFQGSSRKTTTMKIYFSGSIRAGRQDAHLYQEIIGLLKQYGTVLTEHIGKSDINMDLPDDFIYEQDMNWLRESDILIGEVTNPSLGVGYEIGHAVAMAKRVICLYRTIDGKKISAMILGCPDVECFEYNDISDVKAILKRVFG